MSALPLKVTPATTPSKLVPTHPATSSASSQSNSVSASTSTPGTTPSASPPPAHSVLTNPSDISSPHELTAFVETLLEQLDSKFDDMSSQILDRMMQMSTRVDALEASIQDIINGDAPNPSPTPTPSVPPSPSPLTGGSQPRRTRSGLQ
ncbi:hypothetical protein BV25DRAFT_1918713 [Artomyces pyxidatus]|uniref:Uncharacterized protein n=1 Tax=Artomyces pyxidatus TaxID=48021 RepID=A0ACB8SST6_9AGAM|nr:hypothetical protein BV25DRAFT_1918713 [Artomyces pyxidatus]